MVTTNTDPLVFRRALGRAVRAKRRAGNLSFRDAWRIQRALFEIPDEVETAIAMEMLRLSTPESVTVEWGGDDDLRATIRGPFTDFFEWLLANWERIAEIILWIISLFTAESPDYSMV